jgi:O-antigen/teichoic acid export membrane protein
MSAARIEWALIQQLGGQAVTVGLFLVLAMLLPPKDFGLLGMASVWVSVLAAFAESGLGTALVQRQTVRPEHLSTTFAINLGVGALLTVVALALAYPAAWFYRTPGVAGVMAALSVGFVIRAFGLTQAALAQRELNFRALAVRDLVANAIGGVVGIGLALDGRGVWSLVAATLTTAAVGTALLWRMQRWRPSWRAVSRAAAAELWPYGSRILGFNLFKAFAQNTDRLTIGFFLGPHAVGLYTFAARLVIVPASTLAGAFGTYVFPRVARLQEDREAVRNLYRRAAAAVSTLLAPALVAVAALAPAVVPRIGEDWRGAIPVVQVLTIAALMQAVFPLAGQVMKGLDRPGWLLSWSIGFTVLTIVALGGGAPWGVVGMASGFSLAHLIGLPVVVNLTHRLIGTGLADTLGTLLRPLLASVPLAVAIVVAGRVSSPGSQMLLVPLAVAVGGLAYFVAIERLSPDSIAMIRDRWRIRPGTGPSGVASREEAG